MTIPTPLQDALAGRYEIIRELGQGGMATVYLARDVRHDREVALKVIREDLSASIGAGRFLREIKIAAQLQHPHILPLLDSGEADGRLFFVMPYVRGQSLRERLSREGELPVNETVRLLVEIVDALADAHSHGVVHRDIKPDNVMLSGRHALVMDFGVAKAISEATGRNTITTLGVAVGTPTYMSPEQAVADPMVDHRSDIYAVGVIAYEMLTGHPPFAGGSPQQVLAAHVTEKPDAVSKRRPAIPAALDQVIMRCLEKRPADRYQTAGELLAALEPLATPSTGLTPAEMPPHSAAPAQRGRRIITTLVAVGAIAVIGAMAWAARRGMSQRGQSVAIDRVALTTNGRSGYPVLSPDGKEVVYSEALCPTDSVPCTDRLVIQDIATGAKTPVSDSSGILSATGWSASGAWILTRVSTVPGTNQLPHAEVMSHLGGARTAVGEFAAFSPRGDTVLAVRSETLRGARSVPLLSYVAPWTQPGDSVMLTVPAHAILIDELSISADGRWIAVRWEVTGQQNSLLTILDRRGREVASREVPESDYNHGRWLGQTLVRPILANGQGGLERIVIDARTGALGATDTVVLSASAVTPYFSTTADGSLAAYDELHAGLVSLSTLDAPNNLQPPKTGRRVMSDAALKGAGIAPDGQTIMYAVAVTAGRSLRTQLFGVPFSGGPSWQITPPIEDFIACGFASDSKRLVVAAKVPATGTRLTLFEVATGRVLSTADRRDTVVSIGGTRAGFAMQTSTTVVFLDSALRERSRAFVPDSLGHAVTLMTSGASDAVMIQAEPVDFFALLKDDGMFHTPLYLIDTTGRVAPAGAIAGWHGFGYWWLNDGSVLETANTGMDPRPALFRMKPGAPQQRIGYVPGRSLFKMDLSADGRRGVSLTAEGTVDSWLIRNFGKVLR